MSHPFDIPANWAWTTLGEIADVVGGVTKDSKRQGDPSYVEVPYLRVANVQRGYLDLSNIARIRVPPHKAEALRLLPGDVLLNEGGDRDKLGRGWVWDGQITDCIHQNHVFRARIIDQVIEPRLLAHFANSFGQRWFYRNGLQSVNLASISLTAIKSFPVPLPPRNEQARILAALDDHLSRSEAARASVQAAGRRLQRLKKRLLVESVPLDEREGWRICTVAEAGSVDLGRQRHPDWHHGSNMRPYLRVANVFEDRIDTTDVMEMDFPPSVFEKFQLRNGDILLNEGQSPELLGRPAMYRGMPAKVAFTNSLLRFRAAEGIDPEWALLVFRRHMHAGRFSRELRITTNIAHLSASRFKAVEFPVPPIVEQKAIVSRTKETLSGLDRLSTAIERAEQQAIAFRASLLAQAFAGRLVPQDPNDEPASELLARIRAERAAAPPRQRKARSVRTKKELAAPPTRVTGDNYQQEALPL